MSVEVAQGREAHITGTKPLEVSVAGIAPFTERAAQALAIQYISNKDLNAHSYHGHDTYLLGEMEIQGQVLIMLGQEHLLHVDPNQPLPIPHLARLQPITRGHIEILAGSYKVVQRFCQEVEFRKTKGKTKEPAELRSEGRRDNLSEILTNLGQDHLIRKIDSELRMSPEFVQWAKERDARSKGETY